jgi:HEAT repeat protein
MSVVSAPSEGAWICEQLQEWGAAREPRALPALVALLLVEDVWFPQSTKVRRAAAWALGRLGSEAVEQLLADPGGGELAREGAADALGYVESAEAVERLRDLAAEGSPRVVLWAALSLAKHGDAAVDALRDGLERAIDFRCAAHCADALRIIGSKSASSALERYLATEAPDRAEALRELLARRTLLDRRDAGLPRDLSL